MAAPLLPAEQELAVKEFVAHINDMFQTNGNATVETGADIANAEAEAAADADAAADANVDAGVGADARCDTASIATDAGVLRHGVVSAETAIKFLFARKFDVRRAVALFEQHELIRQREHLDQLNAGEEPLHSELSTGKFTILPGRDSSGAAIALFTANLHTPLTVTHQTTLQGVVYQLDVAMQSLDTQRSGLVFIYDMSSSKYSNFDYDLSQKILTLLKGGYPARLKKVLIVTAPLWFKAPFKILRLFVREKLRERVFTVSVPQLSLHVPRAALPQHLGGTAVDINHSAWLRHCAQRTPPMQAQPTLAHHQQQQQQQQRRQCGNEDDLLANVVNISSSSCGSISSIGSITNNANNASNHNSKTVHSSHTSHSNQQQPLPNGICAASSNSLISSIPSTECLASNLNGSSSITAATASHAASTGGSNNRNSSSSSGSSDPNVNTNTNSSSISSPSSPIAEHTNGCIGGGGGGGDGNDDADQTTSSVPDTVDQQQQQQLKQQQEQLLFELWSENPPSSASSGFSDDDSLAGADGDPKTIAQVVDMVRERGRHGLQREYAEIRERAPEGTFTHARLRSNLSKNRYTDVLCYDHSRVVLSSSNDGGCATDGGGANDDDSSAAGDYINANFVDGYKQRNAYISTQGPLPKTAPDFWRMVWEQHCLMIVMTTRAMERGRAKCHQYWEPTFGYSADYGAFTVLTLSVETSEDYTVSRLRLTNNKTDERRIVSHWQFTSWPDYGVPSSAAAMLNFLHKCREEQALMVAELGDTWAGHPRGPPIVVHCSAGIGRTGTFITLDICISRLEDVRTVDIRGTVEKIRSQRAYSIQMPDQYVFCHLAFIEYALNRGFLQPGAADLKGFDGHDDDSE